MTQRLDIALDLAARGWPVLPLNGKLPATAHGYKDASKDPAVIKRWWQGANHDIGIATGRRSGFFVVDIDGDDGEEALKELEKKYGLLPDTVESLTGRGRHLYFKTNGAALDHGAGKLGKGLDVKSDGGYVVAPGSRHKLTGRTYCWEVDHHPDLVEIADPPRWLVERLTKRPAEQRQPIGHQLQPTKYALTALEDECQKVAGAAVGAQEATLNTAAFNLGQLVYELPHEGARDKLIEAGLEMANDPARAPWTEAGIRQKIEHGLRDGADHLRGERPAPETVETREPPKTADGLYYGDDLFAAEDIPIRWLLEDLLAPGLYLLAGPPKLGKSWLALQLARALYQSEHFLGAAVTQALSILYALEDSRARLSKRFKMFPDYPRIPIRTSIGSDLLEQLKADHERHKFGAAIVDTLPRAMQIGQEYQEVMDSLSPVQRWALDHDVALIGTWHTTKPLFGQDGQVIDRGFDRIMGSRGLQAMADGMWLLDAHKLALRGRDFEDGAIALKRDGPMWLAGGQPTGTDRAILDLLSDGEVRPRLWLRERLLDIPIRTLDAHLKALQDAGKLQQPGHGRYRVISRG